MLDITDATYKKEVIDSKTPAIVDFWASWCAPCRMMAPVFEELSSAYKGKLKFAKCSTEQYPGIAEANNVQGIPCLIIFKDGTEFDRIVGYLPKPALKSRIDAILKNM